MGRMDTAESCGSVKQSVVVLVVVVGEAVSRSGCSQVVVREVAEAAVMSRRSEPQPPGRSTGGICRGRSQPPQGRNVAPIWGHRHTNVHLSEGVKSRLFVHQVLVRLRTHTPLQEPLETMVVGRDAVTLCRLERKTVPVLSTKWLVQKAAFKTLFCHLLPRPIAVESHAGNAAAACSRFRLDPPHAGPPLPDPGDPSVSSTVSFHKTRPSHCFHYALTHSTKLVQIFYEVMCVIFAV